MIWVCQEQNNVVWEFQETTGDMNSSLYDSNHDGIVDFADGIRVLESFPNDSKLGDLVIVNNELFVNL